MRIAARNKYLNIKKKKKTNQKMWMIILQLSNTNIDFSTIIWMEFKVCLQSLFFVKCKMNERKR